MNFRNAFCIALMAMGLVACQPDWTSAFDETVDPQQFGSVEIAPIEEALTFARYESEGQLWLMAVQSYAVGRVTGIDLGVVDPIDLYNSHGYEGILELIAGLEGAGRVNVPAVRLTMPVDLTRDHIAVGANYPEHAEDATVEEGPFLFPKKVEPTAPYANITTQGLLDFEVELAWVTLAPLADGGNADAPMGLILANDYTDRATLLRHINVDDIESGVGFTTGKSFPGALPVGNLFVIPRDHRAFAEALQLRLYVNNSLRQQAPVTAGVWDYDEMLRQTWLREDWQWDYQGEQVRLFEPGESIPERTLLLSGTPHGTIFKGISSGQKLRGLSRWLLSGLEGSLASYVIEAYIEDAVEARHYLQPDDRVVVHVHRLGVIDNLVAGSPE